jgi:hypothetical protein
MDIKFTALRIAFSPLIERRDYGSSQEHTAVLTQRVHPESGEKRYCYVAKKPNPETGKRQVLEWFGKNKPSDDAVAKAERRVQYFKHQSAK